MLYFRTTTVPVLSNWSHVSSSMVHRPVELFHCALLARSH